MTFSNNADYKKGDILQQNIQIVNIQGTKKIINGIKTKKCRDKEINKTRAVNAFQSI